MTTVPTRAEAQPSTPSQRARRERILAATVELASQGGFDAVQMREVADKAGVALGTLYRYFPSKIHLLVSVMRHEVELLRERADKRPGDGESPEERVVGMLMRATKALQREPGLAEATLRALMFADTSAAEEVQSVEDVMNALIEQAIDGDDELPESERHSVIRIITMVWWSSLITWLAGRATVNQMRRDLEVAARLLLR